MKIEKDQELTSELKHSMDALRFSSGEKQLMQQRLLHAVCLPEREGAAMKSNKTTRRFTKKAIIAAAVCILAMAGTVFAGGKITTIVSHSYAGYDVTSYEKAVSLADASVPGTILPEDFANGFSFAGANTHTSTGLDESGNQMDSWEEFDAEYRNADGTEVTINTTAVAIDGNNSANATELRTIGGIDVAYSCDEYLNLPPDTQATDEELARAESDAHFYISYGSIERQTQFFNSVSFEKEGVSYLLFTFDDVDRDTLFEMAAELIG